MDIQHKDIPDNNLHEVKGAATASENEVLVANGDGTTSFKTLTAENIQIPDEDGLVSMRSGVFEIYTPAHGMVVKVSNVEADFANDQHGGILIDGSAIVVDDSGTYLISVTNGLNIVGGDISYPTFRNRSLSENIFTGLSGVVHLEAGMLYDFSIAQITYTVLQVRP